MVNLNEMFGTTPRDEVDTADMAEGFQVGMLASDVIMSAMNADHGHRSKAFREGIIQGLRECLV